MRAQTDSLRYKTPAIREPFSLKKIAVCLKPG